MLKMMFQEIKGLDSLKFISNEGVAFVIYDKIEHAEEALQKFQGFKVAEGKFIRIDFLKN